MNKILIWVVVALAGFTLLVVIIFIMLSYLQPATSGQEVKQQMILDNENLIKNMMSARQSEIDSLRKEISGYRMQLIQRSGTIDSLAQQVNFKDGLIVQYRKTVEGLNREVETANKRTIHIKELAKTYESMKVAEMSPILERVDDRTVIDLYNNISARNRKNVILALPANRAALITQKIAQTAGTQS